MTQIWCSQLTTANTLSNVFSQQQLSVSSRLLTVEIFTLIKSNTLATRSRLRQHKHSESYATAAEARTSQLTSSNCLWARVP